MSKFIKVIENRYGNELLINIDAIVWLNVRSGLVCLSGVSGHKDGLRSFDEENMQKILDAINPPPSPTV